jgi:hypothetical protein
LPKPPPTLARGVRIKQDNLYNHIQSFNAIFNHSQHQQQLVCKLNHNWGFISQLQHRTS